MSRIRLIIHDGSSTHSLLRYPSLPIQGHTENFRSVSRACFGVSSGMQLTPRRSRRYKSNLIQSRNVLLTHWGGGLSGITICIVMDTPTDPLLEAKKLPLLEAKSLNVRFADRPYEVRGSPATRNQKKKCQLIEPFALNGPSLQNVVTAMQLKQPIRSVTSEKRILSKVTLGGPRLQKCDQFRLTTVSQLVSLIGEISTAPLYHHF